MHSYVFGECIDNPPLSINPLVSEYSGSKVDPILIKSQPKNKFLKGSFQKIGFEGLKLCECFLSVREEEFDTYADEKAWLATNPQDKQNASDEEIEKFLEMADKLDKADAEKCKVK